MGRNENQKLKITYLIRLFLEKTDMEHYVTMNEIIEYLAANDISAERKSLYSDMDEMNKLGYQIEYIKGNGYHLINRDFDLAELKLLVDAVQFSKFITEKKSEELIEKITKFASRYEASKLKREVVIGGRAKNINEEVFAYVDVIQSAISNGHKIEFIYCNWDEKKHMVPRKDGKIYCISPVAMTWSDSYYYLIAYDDVAKKIKNYRVDKMRDLFETEDKAEGIKSLKRFDIATYVNRNFSMFGGNIKEVKLQVHNSKIGIFIDRFGKEIIIHPDCEGYSVVWVEAAVSPQFLSWIFSLGDGVRIIYPDDVVEAAREEIRRLGRLYEAE